MSSPTFTRNIRSGWNICRDRGVDEARANPVGGGGGGGGGELRAAGRKGQKGARERRALVARSRAQERAGVQEREREIESEGKNTRVKVHDGSLPPPIPTAGGSFSRGLHSRDHQAFRPSVPPPRGEATRGELVLAARAYEARPMDASDLQSPIGAGFLMDCARNNERARALLSVVSLASFGDSRLLIHCSP